MTLPRDTDAASVFVSDFDGTMTRHDFYKLAVESLMPPGTPNYWAEYRAGTITHFEALRRYFASIRMSEAEVLAVVDGMELDPQLPAAVEDLGRAGWSVVVASAGCAWYIHRLLAAAGVSIEVNANPGRFETGAGLLMQMPTDSPYLSQTLGVDKAGVVRRHLGAGRTVAFAGDGFADADAARLVADELRFARADLAQVMTQEGRPFHPFETWSDIARVLLRRGN
ncbi:HAD-IB family phosphatase [Gemmata sp. G18]|uniref:HAD-IB family phosphatase n=1 Tax=Gemmata palustris TaxID=2822762 RepID=A0ABS5BTG3_9BACT|nr:HAD-IB family phosphatase [Gemmata palustris]MBP3956993.1 HAD-IB family phosphatase [Gemmata palustris]